LVVSNQIVPATAELGLDEPEFNVFNALKLSFNFDLNDGKVWLSIVI